VSDSRAILLRLSVKDADIVRRELEALGTQGAAALTRLDAAAQRAAGTGGGATGGGGFGGLRNAMGQAGFQIQDFAVQVQGGTSALTALSQQGSQLLGMFGPAGAIAGAVLTVGILAAKFLDLGGATERAAEAEKQYSEAIARSNGFLLTAIQRTQQLNNARRQTEVANVETGLEAQRARLRDILDEQARLRGDDRAPDAEAFTNSPITPADRRRLADLAAQEGLLRGRINELEALAQRTAEGASGEETDRAEALRRELDDRYRIRQEYETRVLELRQLASRGLFSQAERERAEADAAKKRDEELAQLARRGAGGGTRGGTLDTLGGTLDRLRAEEETRRTRARGQFEDLNARADPTDRLSREFERRAEQLSEWRTQAIISETEYTEAINRTKSALMGQMDEVDRRSRGVNTMGRELGMTFSSAFEDAIVKGKSFRDVLAGIAQDIARMITRQAITGPAANALSSAVSQYFGGGNGGSFDFSKAVSYYGGGGYGGPKAAGGPVSAGMTYLVGERGPELFTAGASGAITPNHALGGASFSPTYNIDARGADPSMMPRLRAEMSAIAQASVAQFADAINRGGSAARLVGRRA
jgi:hypothetical protein